MRCPDNPSHFLINALGLNYEEVTASNLIKVDYEGKYKNKIKKIFYFIKVFIYDFIN